MKLKEAMGGFKWDNEGQDDKGYYFILTDKDRGFDYQVVLIKDTGEVEVNGAYLKTCPRDIQEIISKKLLFTTGEKKRKYKTSPKVEKKIKKEEPKKEKPEIKKEEPKKEKLEVKKVDNNKKDLKNKLVKKLKELKK